MACYCSPASPLPFLPLSSLPMLHLLSESEPREGDKRRERDESDAAMYRSSKSVCACVRTCMYVCMCIYVCTINQSINEQATPPSPDVQDHHPPSSHAINVHLRDQPKRTGQRSESLGLACSQHTLFSMMPHLCDLYARMYVRM